MSLRLDIGCGPNKKEGFLGVDVRKFKGVDIVLDAGKKKWPWKANSVDEVHCSHMIEHLTAPERIHFVNELFRVLKPEGFCTLIAPYWAASRAYGDLTHQWPPVSDFWFYYLDKDWRAANAPHNDGYTCDFACTWGYSLHPSIQSRNQEYQMSAIQNYKEAAQDIIATLKKK